MSDLRERLEKVVDDLRVCTKEGGISLQNFDHEEAKKLLATFIESELAAKDAEIERLRSALEFYATFGSLSHANRLFVQDGGQRARTALERNTK